MTEKTDTDHQAITGWDIGGVNIKACRLNSTGHQVVLRPFHIWQQRDELTRLLTDISVQLGASRLGAITITAELSDAFRTKNEGIHFVLDAIQQAVPDTSLKVFGVDGRFHSIAAARERPLLVAAANWMATAVMISRHFPTCLLVDIGSTTTDIIPIENGKVIAEGRNDPERLINGELLYTGALRTPVFAVVQQVPLWGAWCPVAAEYFATTQDVHLLLGHLPPKQCTSPSADGRPVTAEFAAERLARVVCADAEMLRSDEITAIARHIAAEQIHQISRAMTQVVAGSGVKGPVVPVGVGAFMAEAAAARLGLDCISPDAVFDQAASDAAPAAAVAYLLRELKNV
jgi:hypothetical protein